MNHEEPHQPLYRAVVNHEEQYSLWPAANPIPKGWRDAGRLGTRTEVLDYIRTVWLDLRPLSLRRRMEQSMNSRGV